MKLNQQWKLQMMFSSVHNVHLCMWLIRPTPLKIKMSKDQLGFTVWMTGCSLSLSFTSSIASGLAPRSSAVRQTRALSFQQSFHFFWMNYLQICMEPCNLPDLFISWLFCLFRSLNRIFFLHVIELWCLKRLLFRGRLWSLDDVVFGEHPVRLTVISLSWLT